MSGLDLAAIPTESLFTRYKRIVEDVPYLSPIEVDRNDWTIKNSKNYHLLDPEWKLNEYRTDKQPFTLRLFECGRCGMPTSPFYYGPFTTLCLNCLEGDRQRLIETFRAVWDNKRLLFAPRGKLVRICGVRTRVTYSRPEDYKIEYDLRYDVSNVAVPYYYDVHNVLRVIDLDRRQEDTQ